MSSDSKKIESTVSSEAERAPGDAAHAHEPVSAPTLWPAALALGATLLLWGLISSLIITALGAAVFVLALRGWIQEIRNEHKS